MREERREIVDLKGMWQRERNNSRLQGQEGKRGGSRDETGDRRGGQGESKAERGGERQ
jgi:hypothetical protein